MAAHLRSALFLATAGTLLSCITVTACHNSADRGVVPSETNPLAGNWIVTPTTTSDTCNLTYDIRPISGAIVISGSAASFAIAPACCKNAPFGSGTIDGADVTIETRRMLLAGATCSLQIDEVDTGTTDEMGFSASSDVTVTATGDCGPGFPCEVRGGLTAARCPSFGDCGFVCAATCPSGL